MGEAYTKTLLERAKGSPLDIIIDRRDAPLETITVIHPHAQQIRHLEFAENPWADIIKFSEANSEPLPLLRTLKITPMGSYGLPSQPNPPSVPFFGNAVNLENFAFHSMMSQSLN